MNRACLKNNNNLHEQNQHASSIRPIKNNFVRMKIRTIFLLILIELCALQSYSQEQTSGDKKTVNAEPQQQNINTLFGKSGGKIEHGGWGGFTLGYTKVAGKDAFLSGGRGGWLIDHRFTLGLAGYGFFSNIEFNGPYQPTIDNYSLGGGYGGLLLEPIIAPFSPVHISIPIIIGGGSAFVMDEMNYNGNYHGYNDYSSYSTCFVLESGIDIEVNVVKFFRVALNLSYRYTSNLSLDYYSFPGLKEFSVPSDALRGFNVGLTMKFGKF